MDQKTLNQLVQQAEERKLFLRIKKGEEYCRGSKDVLENFKRVAHGCGLTPMQAWFVYAHKHFDSIANYVRTGKTVSNETIISRIDDLEVYLNLFRGLVHENELNSQTEQTIFDTTTSIEILPNELPI